MVLQLQNFYKDTIKVNVTSTGACNIYVTTAKPTVSPGYLVLSPNSSALREIIYYTSTGTDTTGDYVVIASSGDRGLGGTTARTHSAKEPVRMNITAEHWAAIFVNPTFTGTVTVPTPSAGTDAANKAYVDGVGSAGAADASTTTKGIARSSVASDYLIGTATMTIASPCVVSFTAHGLTLNDMVKFSTTGALPTGVVAGTTYYVISAGLTANAFQIAATAGGTAINSSGSQSGVHTLTRVTPKYVGDTDPRLPVNSFGTSATGTDAYAINPTNAQFTAYVTGQKFIFKADVANTGACTLNVSGLGAKSLKFGGSDPYDGLIAANSYVECMFDGTNVIITNVTSAPAVSQNGTEVYAASATGTDAYAITLVPAITAYKTGQKFTFLADVLNTDTATLAVNGLSAISIKKVSTTGKVALATGDILASQLVEVMYDGTDFVILSNLASTMSYPPMTYQRLTMNSGTDTATLNSFVCTGESDGSVIYVAALPTSGNTSMNIYKWVRDINTGLYVSTVSLASATFGGSPSGNSAVAMVLVGSYLYIFFHTGAAMIGQRFDKATLANQTTMTMSGTSFGTGINDAFSDGTDIYIHTSSGTYFKYTISGTTITYSSSITYTSCGAGGGSACDGTNVWIYDTTTLRKYAKAGGAVVTSLAIGNGSNQAEANAGRGAMVIPKTGLLALVLPFVSANATANTGFGINIQPFTQI